MHTLTIYVQSILNLIQNLKKMVEKNYFQNFAASYLHILKIKFIFLSLGRCPSERKTFSFAKNDTKKLWEAFS